MDLCGKSMSLLLNMLPRFVIAFLQEASIFKFHGCSHSSVILEPKKIKSVTVSTFFPFCLPWSDGTIHHDLSFFFFFFFFNVDFKPAILLFSFTLIKRLFSSSSLPAIIHTPNVNRLLSVEYLMHISVMQGFSNTWRMYKSKPDSQGPS